MARKSSRAEYPSSFWDKICAFRAMATMSGFVGARAIVNVAFVLANRRRRLYPLERWMPGGGLPAPNNRRAALLSNNNSAWYLVLFLYYYYYWLLIAWVSTIKFELQRANNKKIDQSNGFNNKQHIICIPIPIYYCLLLLYLKLLERHQSQLLYLLFSVTTI